MSRPEVIPGGERLINLRLGEHVIGQLHMDPDNHERWTANEKLVRWLKDQDHLAGRYIGAWEHAYQSVEHWLDTIEGME